MITSYLLGYGSFLLGAVLYVLAKIQEFKEMADSNPNPNINFNAKKMFGKEWVNFLRLLIGGIALVLFMPMLVGGTMVDIKNTEGAIVTTLSMETLLVPFYFFVGYSGNSALFALFGKYKKTLLNKVGVETGEK